jgi:cell division protein FtsI/penicillin-binding protein 2
MEVQRQADSLLEGHKGALVLLNAENGEILAIASHPYFDPGAIDTNWTDLVQAQDAPLLNRATQGQYPPGAVLGPFLLGYAAERGTLLPPPQETGYNLDGSRLDCALPPSSQPPWGELVANGCPGALVRLAERYQAGQLEDLFASLGFYTSPDLPLPVAAAQELPVERVAVSAVGQGNLTVTPLQMALAAASLSSQGIRPAPQIAGAVQTPQQGWIALPTSDTHETLLAGSTIETTQALAMSDAPFWQTVANAQTANARITWYLAGTLPQWQGAPLALALVLEEDNPQLAVEIGKSLLLDAVK